MTTSEYDDEALHEIDDWAKAIGEKTDSLVNNLKSGDFEAAGACEEQLTLLTGEMRSFLSQVEYRHLP